MAQAVEKLQRCARILSTESGGEAILARLSDGCFFGLGAVGTLVWTRLAQPATIFELTEFLKGACDSLPECAEGEIAAFVEELRREGLLEPVSSGAEHPEAQVPVITERGRHAYSAPKLDRGTLRHAASGNSSFYDGGLTSSGGPGGLS
jgi:hypothetical protein